MTGHQRGSPRGLLPGRRTIWGATTHETWKPPRDDETEEPATTIIRHVDPVNLHFLEIENLDVADGAGDGATDSFPGETSTLKGYVSCISWMYRVFEMYC